MPITALPEHLQAALTEQIGLMRVVDRETLRSTVEEFLEELERVGLSFPGRLDGALDMLDGRHFSASAASRLRRLRSVSDRSDPWERIAGLPVERMMPILAEESPEVAAVMLSKLDAAKVAELRGRLPGERARPVAYAVALTSRIDPGTVPRIGQSLAAGLDAMPEQAFETDPAERVGAILNVSATVTRDEVFQGLETEDADFASRVRKAIFTLAHIPGRLEGGMCRRSCGWCLRARSSRPSSAPRAARRQWRRRNSCWPISRSGWRPGSARRWRPFGKVKP